MFIGFLLFFKSIAYFSFARDSFSVPNSSVQTNLSLKKQPNSVKMKTQQEQMVIFITLPAFVNKVLLIGLICAPRASFKLAQPEKVIETERSAGRDEPNC